MLRGIDYLKWEFEGGHAMLPTWRMEVPRLVVFLSGGYGGQDSNRLLRADDHWECVDGCKLRSATGEPG